MRVPKELAEAFGAPFEKEMARFLVSRELIDDETSLQSQRFLSRSVVPHVTKLSEFFNRLSENQPEALDGGYWKTGSNTKNLRLAYFLAFMPPNLFRMSSVWNELHRLGYRWPFEDPLRAIDVGSGPATAVSGVAAGETYGEIGLPRDGNWALIDLDNSVLDMGMAWATQYLEFLGRPGWEFRLFPRKIELDSLLPRAAPRFQLWTQSFFLNEMPEKPASEVASALLATWSRHLENEGLVLWVEPALKKESRRLLEVRKALLKQIEKEDLPFQVLLPCLGHQACGALAEPEDWCHEQVVWWRPPYLRKLDDMTNLDRKSLPFSYLVISKTRRPLGEIFPKLAGFSAGEAERLVSPPHSEGRDLEFFICGQTGKRRARFRPSDPAREEIERGTLLLGSDARGTPESTRIDSVKRIQN